MNGFFLSLLLTLLLSSVSSSKNNIEIVFAGDAMMHSQQLDAASKGNGVYDFSGYYTAIAPYISSADYAVVNLELPLAGSGYSGYPQFCAPDSYLDPLVDAGFDLFLNANNHILDKYDKGLRRTLDVLDQRGLSHIGAYRNKQERDSSGIFIEDIGGFKIAFLNYTYGTNGLVARDGTVVNYNNRQQMDSDITEARKRGAELICVCIHWGEEYRLLPDNYEKDYANFLLDRDVDLIIGGHPHVIQPLEIRKSQKSDKNIFLCYSLGNFISSMKKTDTRGGAMCRVSISRDANGKARIDSASYRTVMTLKPGGAVKNFCLVPGEKPTGGYMEAERREFYNSAKKIFDKHNVNVPEDTRPISAYQK